MVPAYAAALSAYNLGYSNALAGLTTAIDGYNVSVTEDNRLIYQDRQWTGLSYMETVSKDAATGSDPAKIAAGGNLAIQGQLFNSNSQVVAGGQLSADQAPQNQQTQALVKHVQIQCVLKTATRVKVVPAMSSDLLGELILCEGRFSEGVPVSAQAVVPDPLKTGQCSCIVSYLKATRFQKLKLLRETEIGLIVGRHLARKIENPPVRLSTQRSGPCC